MKKKNTEAFRRMPVTDKFMNYKTNDIIYGFMRCEAATSPVLDKDGNVIRLHEYIPRTKLAEDKKKLAEMCGITVRTVDRHIQKLLEAGLLAEPTEEEAKADGFRSYFFPYDRGKYFVDINKKVLRKVVETGNPHAVRIYLYLLDQHRFRGEIGQKYIFSKADLKKKLGYNESTKSVDKTIGKVLDDLVAAGLIKLSKKTVYCDNGVRISTTQKNQLDFIASKAEHLKK